MRTEDIPVRKNMVRIKIACPVDVEIYTSNGLLAGSVIDNIANTVLTDKVNVYTVGEVKYADCLEDDNYKIKITGTDTGIMTYVIQNIDAETNEIIDEQEFANVVLANGKKFTSNIIVKNSIASEVKTEDVKLYVIDDSDAPEKEVLPDGNGTEVPINKDDKDDTPTVPDSPTKPTTPNKPTEPNTPTAPDTPNNSTEPDTSTTPDTSNKPTVPDNGVSSSNTNTGTSASTGTSTVTPVSDTNTKSMTVNLENKVTGKTIKAVAKKTGSSVTIKLGTENNGYYANVYTTNDEYICSVLIGNGRAEFNVPDGIKIKIVIDSIAYGEDVSSGAGITAESNGTSEAAYSVIIAVTALFGIYLKTNGKHLGKRKITK